MEASSANKAILPQTWLVNTQTNRDLLKEAVVGNTKTLPVTKKTVSLVFGLAGVLGAVASMLGLLLAWIFDIRTQEKYPNPALWVWPSVTGSLLFIFACFSWLVDKLFSDYDS